jgi:hypothetical protein
VLDARHPRGVISLIVLRAQGLEPKPGPLIANRDLKTGRDKRFRHASRIYQATHRADTHRAASCSLCY